MVNAKSGDVEYVDELGAASGPADPSVQSENQDEDGGGNGLQLESAKTGNTDGQKSSPATWIALTGVITAAGLIVWKIRRPKGG